MNTASKTVLITGGGSGIGLALAQRFLAERYRVVITGRNLSKLETAKRENPYLEITPCDVTKEDEIEALLDSCNKEYGGVDILVNNAGVFQNIDLKTGDVPLDKQLQEVDIDLNGPIRMVHYFLPGLLKKSEAAIVNVSSGLAFVPMTSAPVYSATKAALHAWTQSLRRQLFSTNVRVIELMPPVVDTDMTSGLEGFPKLSPVKLADEFYSAFTANKLEITPGQSSQLKLMRRLAPGMIFKMLNKEAA